jgi:NDP-sugar pyrophosphorylase family protein
MDLTAMIFSAGMGTRLYPLTEKLPKALAPIGNGTLLSQNIEFLKSQGIERFIVNTHHFASDIAQYLKENQNFGSEIIISHEKELLDTAGGLRKVYEFISMEKSVLCFNVDIITDIDIDRLYQFHLSNDISLAAMNRPSSRKLLFNRSGLLVGWENIKSGEIIINDGCEVHRAMAYSGIAIIDTHLIKRIESGKKLSLTHFYLDLCKTAKIAAYEHTGSNWFDCGNMEKLQAAERFISENRNY